MGNDVVVEDWMRIRSWSFPLIGGEEAEREEQNLFFYFNFVILSFSDLTKIGIEFANIHLFIY